LNRYTCPGRTLAPDASAGECQGDAKFAKGREEKKRNHGQLPWTRLPGRCGKKKGKKKVVK
jgi:hypothetical protein